VNEMNRGEFEKRWNEKWINVENRLYFPHLWVFIKHGSLIPTDKYTIKGNVVYLRHQGKLLAKCTLEEIGGIFE
jgi:hypothetical protein